MADNLRGVEAVYRVVNYLRDELLNDPFCNEVTIGDLTEVDLAKQTMFPLGHITLESIAHNNNSLTLTLTIFNLDVVNISKEPEDKTETTSYAYGNDNTMYILTNQLYTINRLISRLKSNPLMPYEWELDNDPISDVVSKEYENMITGFQTTLSITVPNDISKC